MYISVDQGPNQCLEHPNHDGENMKFSTKSGQIALSWTYHRIWSNGGTAPSRGAAPRLVLWGEQFLDLTRREVFSGCAHWEKMTDIQKPVSSRALERSSPLPRRVRVCTWGLRCPWSSPLLKEEISSKSIFHNVFR